MTYPMVHGFAGQKPLDATFESASTQEQFSKIKSRGFVLFGDLTVQPA